MRTQAGLDDTQQEGSVDIKIINTIAAERWTGTVMSSIGARKACRERKGTDK
jgi:hypothetical protein